LLSVRSSNVTFVVGVACLVAAWSIGFDRPEAVGFLLLALAVTWLPAAIARRHMRKLLRSGDVAGVLGAWTALTRRRHRHDGLGPLMAATAYAAYGWTAEARAALRLASRGPAWDSAVEQRLFVEALLDVFEGAERQANAKALALDALPLPRVGLLAQRRVRSLRAGIVALARAFAHTSVEGDIHRLSRAGRASPLVYWAMRYGEAVVHIDEGSLQRARDLLADAPSWPEESAFRAFDAQIRTRLA
jgi:hypothetical protein